MKTLITLLVSLFYSTHLFSQFFTSTRINLSKDIAYEKYSGKRLSQEELLQIFKEKDNTRLDPVINKFGEPDYYIYDPNKSDSNYDTDLTKRTKSGETFPPFVMKTIDNKLIDSEKFNEKYIIMQFQLSFVKPFFNSDNFRDADILIKELLNEYEIVPIVITGSPKKDILNVIDTSQYNMHFVSDANNFNLRYLVFKFPTYILIDKSGKLVSYYEYNELNKIKEYIVKNK